MKTKLELRKYAKEIRKTLDINQLSDYFCKKIMDTKEYKASKNVMIYYPLKYELSFLQLIDYTKDKNFYLPKIEGNNLLVCSFDRNTNLKESNLKILEPCTNPCPAKDIDLVIVPALMADSNNFRLGYGGGYYDRFIDRYGKNFVTISAIPKELFVEKLPVEHFDKKIDLIKHRISHFMFNDNRNKQ